MKLSPRVRRVLLAVGVLLLLGMTWSGVSGGVHVIPQSRTAGQWTQTVAQLCYGILSLATVLTARQWGRWWSRAVRGGWLASVTVAAGFASVVWGGTSLWTGVASGALSLLIALAIVWLLRTGLGVPAAPGAPGHP